MTSKLAQSFRMLSGIEQAPSPRDRVHESADWAMDPKLVAKLRGAMTGLDEVVYLSALNDGDSVALSGLFRNLALTLGMDLEEAVIVGTVIAQDMMPSRTLPLAPKDDPRLYGRPRPAPGGPINRDRPLAPKDEPGLPGAVAMGPVGDDKKVGVATDADDTEGGSNWVSKRRRRGR